MFAFFSLSDLLFIFFRRFSFLAFFILQKETKSGNKKRSKDAPSVFCDSIAWNVTEKSLKCWGATKIQLIACDVSVHCACVYVLVCLYVCERYPIVTLWVKNPVILTAKYLGNFAHLLWVRIYLNTKWVYAPQTRKASCRKSLQYVCIIYQASFTPNGNVYERNFVTIEVVVQSVWAITVAKIPSWTSVQ